MTPEQIGSLYTTEFLWYLQGLSDKSRWLKSYSDLPKSTHTPAEVAAVTAAARR